MKAPIGGPGGPEGPGPTGPCGDTKRLKNHVKEFEDINIEHELNEQHILSILGIEDSQMIYQNPVIIQEYNDGGYAKAYEVKYKDFGTNVVYIHSETHEIIMGYHLGPLGYSAETVSYGTQPMRDQRIGDDIFLSDDQFKTYDFNGGNVDFDFNSFDPSNYPSDLIPQGSVITGWTANETTKEVYQANYVTHTCTNAYLDLLDYNIGRTVHIAANASSGGFIGAFIYVHDESDVYIHIVDTWANVFEVIGHEIGHALLYDLGFQHGIINCAISSPIPFSNCDGQFLIDMEFENALGESLADLLGQFITSEADPNSNGVPWASPGFDFANNNSCLDQNNVTPPNNPTFGDLSMKEFRESMGRFYFILAQSIGISEVVDLMLEALNTIPESPDATLLDLMDATTAAMDAKYGRCSDQGHAIRAAWDDIVCEEDFGPGQTKAEWREVSARIEEYKEVCEFTIVGPEFPDYICSDDDYLSLCLDGGISTNYAWTVIAPNSTSFDLSGDQTGNGTIAGTCMEITSIPDMPCYPQDITISVYTTVDGTRLVDDIIITIVDCGDPEMRLAGINEYYNSNNQKQTHHTEKTNFQDLQRASKNNSSNSHFDYYNLSGQLIFSSNQLGYSDTEFSITGQLLVVVQKDSSNRVISVTKEIFIQ